MYINSVCNLANRFYVLAHAIKFNQDAIKSIMSDILNAFQANEVKINQLTNKSRELNILKKEISFEDIQPSYRYEMPIELIFKNILKSVPESEREANRSYLEAARSNLKNVFNPKHLTLYVYVFPPETNPRSSAQPLRNKISLEIAYNDALKFLKNDSEAYDLIESTLVHELVHLNQFRSEERKGSEFFQNKDLYGKPEPILHSNSVIEQEAIIAEVWQELLQNLNNGNISLRLLNAVMRSHYNQNFGNNIGNFTLEILRLCPSFVYAESYIENTDLKELAKFLKEKFNFSKKNYPTKENFFQKFLKIGGKFIHQYNDDIIKKMTNKYHELYGVEFFKKNEKIEKIEKLKSVPQIEQILSGSFNIMEQSAKEQLDINNKLTIIKNFINKSGIENNVKIKVEDIPSEVLHVLEAPRSLKYISFDFIKKDNSLIIMFYNEGHALFDIQQYYFYNSV
jgi:hypothetical protein